MRLQFYWGVAVTLVTVIALLEECVMHLLSKSVVSSALY